MTWFVSDVGGPEEPGSGGFATNKVCQLRRRKLPGNQPEKMGIVLRSFAENELGLPLQK